MEGKELFQKGDFFEFINLNLPKIQNIRLGRKTKNNPQIINELYYTLAACEQCGYYCDYLNVLKKLHELRPIEESNWKPETLILISNFAVEALIYCLYNNQNEQLGLQCDISEQIEKSFAYQDKLIRNQSVELTQRQRDLRELYSDYKNGKAPVYILEFLYPFEPIIPDYTFDLSRCKPYISLEVKKVPRDSDNFTSFKFKAYGLIKPDILWMGPQWKMREKMPPIQKALPIVNTMLLQAVKASPGKIVLPYSIEQVSTASMLQYRWDESRPVLGGTITGTDFRAQWVGGNAPWHVFTPEEMAQLNERIVYIYGSKAFVTTFHHAMNLLSAGFNLEGFLLLCSSCEGMVYYWCEEVADICGIGDSYRLFAQTKTSKCDNCELFKCTPLKNKPCGDMKPSVIDVLNFLQKEGCITKKECDELKKYLAKVRNDQLRNTTAHGANNKIKKDEVDNSLKALFTLQERFLQIENQLKQQQNVQ